jgi:hypothetical protein
MVTKQQRLMCELSYCRRYLLEQPRDRTVKSFERARQGVKSIIKELGTTLPETHVRTLGHMRFCANELRKAVYWPQAEQQLQKALAVYRTTGCNPWEQDLVVLTLADGYLTVVSCKEIKPDRMNPISEDH